MTSPHPETAAICAQPQYEQWAREHRGSIWDYSIDGETDPQGAVRRRHAARLCMKCPLKAKCLAKHDALVAANLHRMRTDPNYDTGAREKDALVPGVWGGRIFSGRIDRDQDPVGQTSFMPRNDLLNAA